MTTTVIDPTLNPTTVHVYAALVSCWQIYGQSPSQYELQVACRCSNTSIQKAIKQLKDRGHILSAKFGVRSLKVVDMDRKVYKHPPDPFAELDPDAPVYWKAQE